MTQVSTVAQRNTPHIVLKRAAITDIDGVAILPVACDDGNRRDKLMYAAHLEYP